MSDLSVLVDRMEAAGALRVYELGKVPSSPPGDYAVLMLDGKGRPYGTRTDGVSPSSARRLTVQMFASSFDGLIALADFADEAFRDVNLSELPGSPRSTRELVAPQTDRDPDAETRLYLLHTYRF